MKAARISAELGVASSIRRHVDRRHVVIVACCWRSALGGWASTAEISGALIAQGSIVVDSNVKKVQHPTGGVVGEVRVRDGDQRQGRRHSWSGSTRP